MTDFFDYLYYLACTNKKSKVLFPFLRQCIRVLSNIILPIYYRISSLNPNYRIDPNVNINGFVVSLTSFPARINDLWKVIESLLRQSCKPDAIYLWLSSDQFPNFDSIPQSLISLQKRGLIIQIRDGDLKSHKKYFYMLKEFSDKKFVIVDDDVFYNSKTLEKLIEGNREYPNNVICNHSSWMECKDDVIIPYKDWVHSDYRHSSFISNSLLPIGVGGVLYPPNSLYYIADNQDVFMKLCPKADDLWLKVMSLMQHTCVYQTKHKMAYLPILIRNNKCLYSDNVGNDNDLQLINIAEYVKSNYEFCLINTIKN